MAKFVVLDNDGAIVAEGDTRVELLNQILMDNDWTIEDGEEDAPEDTDEIAEEEAESLLDCDAAKGFESLKEMGYEEDE